jgi:phenylacetate-CoA ligase
MWFALYCERHGIQFPSLKFIISSYEFTSVLHRRIMQRVFGVPVINLYGSSETGHLLIETEPGQMTPSPETAFLELCDIDAQRIGQLLVTTRTNEYLPLLRYEIGDLAEILPNGYRIHGRVRDALRRSDNTLLSTYHVDQSFNDLLGIAHYQVRQSTDGKCEVFLLPEIVGDTLSDTKFVVADRLARLMGSPINIVVVPLIPPEDSGKFRLTTRVA